MIKNDFNLQCSGCSSYLKNVLPDKYLNLYIIFFYVFSVNYFSEIDELLDEELSFTLIAIIFCKDNIC